MMRSLRFFPRGGTSHEECPEEAPSPTATSMNSRGAVTPPSSQDDVVEQPSSSLGPEETAAANDPPVPHSNLYSFSSRRLIRTTEPKNGAVAVVSPCDERHEGNILPPRQVEASMPPSVPSASPPRDDEAVSRSLSNSFGLNVTSILETSSTATSLDDYFWWGEDPISDDSSHGTRGERRILRQPLSPMLLSDFKTARRPNSSSSSNCSDDSSIGSDTDPDETESLPQDFCSDELFSAAESELHHRPASPLFQERLSSPDALNVSRSEDEDDYCRIVVEDSSLERSLGLVHTSTNNHDQDIESLLLSYMDELSNTLQRHSEYSRRWTTDDKPPSPFKKQRRHHSDKTTPQVEQSATSDTSSASTVQEDDPPPTTIPKNSRRPTTLILVLVACATIVIASMTTLVGVYFAVRHQDEAVPTLAPTAGRMDGHEHLCHQLYQRMEQQDSSAVLTSSPTLQCQCLGTVLYVTDQDTLDFDIVTNLLLEEGALDGAALEDFTSCSASVFARWMLVELNVTNGNAIVDVYALGVLYHSWQLMEVNWLQESDLCLWDQVDCNVQGRVRGIALPQSGLVGSLPAELALLQDLRILDLSHNRLSGSIPPTLESLRQLRKLDLSGNRLTGAFTLPRANLLDSLLLGDNRLTGSIPWQLSLLPNLRELDLSGNHMRGTIPASLGQLVELQRLDLSNCQGLEGTLPTELGFLTDLERLELHDNPYLNGTLPEAYVGLERLVHLNVARTGLSGSVPTGMCDLVHLDFIEGDCGGQTPLVVDCDCCVCTETGLAATRNGRVP